MFAPVPIAVSIVYGTACASEATTSGYCLRILYLVSASIWYLPHFVRQECARLLPLRLILAKESDALGTHDLARGRVVQG